MEITLDSNLHKVKEIMGQSVSPTVYWSGNGCHIILPVEPLGIPFGSYPEFDKFEDPSKEFLKFAAHLLTGGR